MPRNSTFETEILPILTSDAFYGRALRMTKCPADAEDLVGDVTVRALRFIDRYEPGTNAKAWCFTILRHTWINVLESRKREQRRLDQLAYGDAPQLAYGEVFDEAIDMKRRWDRTSSALGALRPQFREALERQYFAGDSISETAEAMGTPRGTVMARRHRGLRHLRALAC